MTARARRVGRAHAASSAGVDAKPAPHGPAWSRCSVPRDRPARAHRSVAVGPCRAPKAAGARHGRTSGSTATHPGDAQRCERYLGRFVGVRLVEAGLAGADFLVIVLDPAAREARHGCRAADEVAELPEVALIPLRTRASLAPVRRAKYGIPRIPRTGTSARS